MQATQAKTAETVNASLMSKSDIGPPEHRLYVWGQSRSFAITRTFGLVIEGRFISFSVTAKFLGDGLRLMNDVYALLSGFISWVSQIVSL